MAKILEPNDLKLYDLPLAKKFFNAVATDAEGLGQVLLSFNSAEGYKDTELKLDDFDGNVPNINAASVYLGTINGKTVEDHLYDTFKEPEAQSEALKSNGFITLYYLVRQLVESEASEEADVLKMILGENTYKKFKSTSMAKLNDPSNVLTVNIASQDAEKAAQRTISAADFRAFIKKYPHVYDVANRQEIISKLEIAPKTTLITVPASEFSFPEIGDWWEPLTEYDSSTHFVWLGDFDAVEAASNGNEAYVPRKRALIRKGYIKQTVKKSIDNLDIEEYFDLNPDSDEDYEYMLDQKLFKNAGVAWSAPQGTQVRVLKEGLGKSARFSQVIVYSDVFPGEEIEDPNYDGKLYIDSAVLRRFKSYKGEMGAIDSGLPTDALFYKTELPRIEVGEPNDKYNGPSDWPSKDACDPWYNEKSRDYRITISARVPPGQAGLGPLEAVLVIKEAARKLLSYYNKKSSDVFIEKLLKLNGGLFASLQNQAPDPTTKEIKCLVAIPQTYFDHPALGVDDIASGRAARILKEMNEKFYLWPIRTDRLERHIKQVKSIIKTDFTNRIRKAKQSGYTLIPAINIENEVEKLDNFFGKLKHLLKLNDTKVSFNKANTLIFALNDDYFIEHILLQDVSAKEKAEEDEEVSMWKFLGVGLSCLKEDPAFHPRTLAYLLYGNLMNQAIKSGEYPGLQLLTVFTRQKNVDIISGEADTDLGSSLKKQIKTSRPKVPSDTVKTKSELEKENQELTDPKKNLNSYKNRVNARTSNFDGALKNLEKTMEGFTDPEEWYDRLLNKLDIKDIIAVGYACAGKLLPASEIIALIRKNVLKTIGYENLKGIFAALDDFFNLHAADVCPDLLSEYTKKIEAKGAPLSGTASEDEDQVESYLIDEKNKKLNSILGQAFTEITKEIEDDYLCFKNGKIQSAIGPEYTFRNKRGLDLFSDEIIGEDDELGDVAAQAQAQADAMATQIEAQKAAIQTAEAVQSDFSKKSRDDLHKNLNKKLVGKLDHNGLLNCLFKVIDRKRDEIERELTETLMQFGIDPYLVRQLLHPEDFIDDVLGKIRSLDPEGSIHRIETMKPPSFDIPELPMGHDDPLVAVDREIDKLYDILGGAVTVTIKTAIDEFLKLCDGLNVARAIDKALDDKDPSVNPIRDLGKLPENTLDMTRGQLKKLKNDRRFLPPNSLSGLDSNSAGDLNINSLIDGAGNDSGTIFENIITKMGEIPTDELIQEALSLMDDLSKILKPSEICLMMLGDANEVVYKIVFKVVKDSNSSLYSGESASNKYENLRTFFVLPSDVREFFTLLGRYIDLSFCEDIVSSMSIVSSNCERTLQDDWYCSSLQELGYTEEQCKEIITNRLNRDRSRLEQLGDLLLSDNMIDVSSASSILETLQDGGIQDLLPPYVQKLLENTSDSFLDMARTRFDIEVRGLKSIFVDSVFVEGGSVYKRTPERGRDYLHSWAEVKKDVTDYVKSVGEQTAWYDPLGLATGEDFDPNYPGETNPNKIYYPKVKEAWRYSYEGKGYTDTENWPQGDVTTRKVAESFRLNLLMDNSNILKFGPVNVYPTHFEGVEENSYNETLLESNVPAKEHYTLINYHKILESSYTRYITQTIVGTRRVSWDILGPVAKNQNSELFKAFAPNPGDPTAYTGPLLPAPGGAGPLQEFHIDKTTNELVLEYEYDVTIPVIPAAASEGMQDYKAKFPKPTAKLIEFAYPKYIQIRPKEIYEQGTLGDLPAAITEQIKDSSIDTMEVRIYDRASKFNSMNVDLALPTDSDTTSDVPLDANIIIELGGAPDDEKITDIRQLADDLRDTILDSDEGKLDILGEIDIAKIFSYQQWLFSAMFTDSFGSLIGSFDSIPDDETNRRRKFMKSCMKIYDLAFSQSTSNIFSQIIRSPLFDTEIFDRLTLSGPVSTFEFANFPCTPHGVPFTGDAPPPIGDLLNTDALRDLARLMMGDQTCNDDPFRSTLERIAVLAYIRVVILENLLRGLMIFTTVSPLDILKDNVIFLEYLKHAIKRSASSHSDFYYQKILDVCFDIIVSDVGCGYGVQPVKVLDKLIVFEDMTAAESFKALKEKKYNLEYVLNHPKGQMHLQGLKEDCLLHIVLLQIEEIDEPVSRILTIPGVEYERLGLKSAILNQQKNGDGSFLKDPWYCDLPLNLIDYDFYKGKDLSYEAPYETVIDSKVLEVDDTTYMPSRFFNTIPLEPALEKEIEDQKDLGKTADINMDKIDELHDPFESSTNKIGQFGSFQDNMAHVDVGGFLNTLRRKNRSSYYEQPPVFSANNISEQVIATIPNYVPISLDEFKVLAPEIAAGGWTGPLWMNLGIHVFVDHDVGDTQLMLWVPQSLYDSLLNNDGSPATAGTAEEFTQQVLEKGDDQLYSSDMTPLGETTKNGGFVIQRYLKMSLKDDVDPVELKLAFNFGFDGGAKFGLDVGEGGEDLGGSSGFTYSPQSKEIVANTEFYDFDTSSVKDKNVKDYFALWKEQGASYFSTKALECALLNSFLFNLTAEDIFSLEEGIGLEDIYKIESTSLKSFFSGGGSLAAKLKELVVHTLYQESSPGELYATEDWWNGMLNSPLSKWFKDISVGQRLVYVFPHNMDITKSALSQIPPGIINAIESEGFFDVLNESDELKISGNSIIEDRSDGADILDTTYEMGPSHNGSFAKILRKNLQAGEDSSMGTMTPFSNDISGKTGDFLKEEMFASRYLRQQEMVVEPNITNIGLKRIYSLPIKGCFSERRLDEFLDKPYVEVIKYYAQKQKAFDEEKQKTIDDIAVAYVLEDNEPLYKLCGLSEFSEPHIQALYLDFSEALAPNSSLKYYMDQYITHEGMLLHIEVDKFFGELYLKGQEYLQQQKEVISTESDLGLTLYQEKAIDVVKEYILSTGPGDPPTAPSKEVVTQELFKNVPLEGTPQGDLLEADSGLTVWDISSIDSTNIDDWIENGMSPLQTKYQIEADQYMILEAALSVVSYKNLKGCVDKLTKKQNFSIESMVDDFCDTTQVDLPPASSAATKKGNINELLTENLFLKPNAKLLNKYILSEYVIKNLTLLHTIFHPVDVTVSMDNIFVSTKDYLYSLGEGAAVAPDEYFARGNPEYSERGGAVGATKIAIDRASTSKASNAIVSYFQDLAPKMILKGFVSVTDPAWKRAFKIQDLTGASDKALPGIMAALRPVPLVPPPFGDPTAPITAYGIVYLGLSFLEPLSENHNAQLGAFNAWQGLCEEENK